MVTTPARARRLSFRLSRCLFLELFLIAGFPAVCYLRQQFSDLLYLFLGPEMQGHSTARYGFRLRHLVGRYVSA